MLWDRGHRSNDVIDNRGRPAMGGMGGGGGGAGLGLLMGLVRSKFGWFGVIVLVAGYFLLTNMGGLGGLGGTDDSGPGGQRAGLGNVEDPAPAGSDEQATFVGFVIDDVQATWDKLSPIQGNPYQHAKLVLFTGAVNTACGTGESATGPFYCPGDQKVYIDLGFYDDLRRRFGAPGDFAQAYVLAHEIGHHVQNVTGTERQMRRLQQQRPGDRNTLSVAMELQADCYAGIWGKHAQEAGNLDPGDIEEALKAASAVGDDRISEMSGSAIRPESFTHGSAAQRMTWFRRGFDTGRVDACDTFADR